MSADNKMWEGHRIIYPELRNSFVQTKEQPFLRPLLDEQKLEILESSIRQAIDASSFITLVLWSKKGPQKKEVIILKQEIKQNGLSLKCRDKADVISYILLRDILDVLEN